MRTSELLRLVDQMNHDKNIKREIIFDGIEAALQLAVQKRYGEDTTVVVSIDRDSGEIHIRDGDKEVKLEDLGRIAAQVAKQVMIQKIREAESTAIYNEYVNRKGDLVHGTIQRHEGGSAIVSLGKTEAILPRSEQIPGETHHVNDRIKAVILDVKKVGQRVKIVLSRCHPDFVRRLFEQEIPEISDRTIEIKAVAREAGYRTKIAVSSIDLKVDCVGACVGVRGSRIKNVVDELNGERIDIVRWNDSLQVMIPNALQPAQIEEVFLYPRPGRAIVLVKDDQLSLAIGRRGQNVRLASKLVGWDIEIMTHEELNNEIERAVTQFNQIPGMTDELIEALIEEGLLSWGDLSVLDPVELAEMSGMSQEQAEEIIAYAEEFAEREEEEKEQQAAAAEAAADQTVASGAEATVATGEQAGSPATLQAPPPGEAVLTAAEPVQGTGEAVTVTESPEGTETVVATPANEAAVQVEETSPAATEVPVEPKAEESPNKPVQEP